MALRLVEVGLATLARSEPHDRESDISRMQRYVCKKFNDGKYVLTSPNLLTTCA